MLRVHMLGCYSIILGGKYLHGDLGANGRRLSAYLFSFPNRPHRRERLIDLFWSDLAPNQGNAALSTALWRLRRLLGLGREEGEPRIVPTTAREVLLEITDERIVDAHLFHASVARALQSDPFGTDSELLEGAVGLYSGPFLDGQDDDWILEEREHLHGLYVRALSELMRRHGEQHRYEDALVCGRRILAADPMRETVQRCVMLLYVLNGQRGEAILQFDRCARMLREDCDVDPMPETQNLASMIRSGEVFGQLPRLQEALFARSR
jgi:DNA-binding SARP family transcriptional activator